LNKRIANAQTDNTNIGDYYKPLGSLVILSLLLKGAATLCSRYPDQCPVDAHSFSKFVVVMIVCKHLFLMGEQVNHRPHQA